MGRSLQVALIAAEALMTFLRLIPTFLCLLLNLHYVNYKIGRNRKKMIKMLRREGLPETVSIRIAEHMFPKIELSPWKLMSLMSGGGYREGKGENAPWKAG
jgi:hypothetical protein